MIETSGHGALKENYFLDDGAYMAIKVVIEQVRVMRAGFQWSLHAAARLWPGHKSFPKLGWWSSGRLVASAVLGCAKAVKLGFFLPQLGYVH